MAKALKTAALIVGAVALVATGIGAAAGLGIGLGLTAGTLATIATVATVASVAAGALSIGAALTAKKPTAQSTGSPTQFAADPDAGIPVVLGRTGTAGNIVARFGFDTRDAGDNDRQSFVSVLSLGPVAEVEPTLSVDRQPVSFDAGGRAVGGYANFMWRTTQRGLLAGAALAFGTGAGSPPGWTANHKLSGKAATAWTLRFDTKAKQFQSGVPAPMNTVRGWLVYDPRKDSTYPGGSGSHRMADPANRAAYDAAVATWEYSENPYLHGLAFVHGYWQRDTANATSNWQRVMGMGAPSAGIEYASFVDAANVADANGWKVGGVIYSGDDKWGSLKKILQPGMGEPLALGAKISCFANAPKVSLATIGVDDVVGDCSVGATQPRRDRINTITPRFRLEANNWQLLPGAPISVAEHVITDKGKRSRTQDYPLIQSSAQVGTAVRYDIENAREFGPIVLPCKLVWMGYKPGDCVTANLPELGLNGQPILLLNRDLDPSGGVVTLTARSETAGKHAFALGQTATPPPTAGITGPALVPTPAEGAWTLSVVAAAPSVVTPTLVVTGSVAPNVDGVVFEYRVFGSGGAWTVAGSDAPTVVRREISGVLSDTQYEVAVSYTRQGIVGDRRIIGPVTTPSIYFGMTDEERAALAAVQARVAAMSSDGVLTAGSEKLQARIDFQAINDDWAAKRALAMDYEGASTAIGAARIAADTAYYALGAYLAGLSPSWTDTAVDTAIDPAIYIQKWGDAYARNAGLSAQLNLALSPAVAALDVRVSRVASDGWLTAGEKPGERIAFQALNDDWGALRNKSISGGLEGAYPAVGAARVAADNSIYALSGYLNALSPYWLDATTDTPINPTDYRTTWSAAYANVAGLNAAITGLPGADGADGFTVEASTASFLVPCDFLGNPKPGALPIPFTLKVLRGAVDVTASATFDASTSSSGVAVGGASGAYSLTAVGGDGGYVNMAISYAGIALPSKRIPITKKLDQAPASSVQSSSRTWNASIAQTTYVDASASSTSAVMTCGASGVIAFSAGGTYSAGSSGGGTRSVTVEGKVQYRSTGSGSWLDASGPVAGSTAFYRPADGPDPGSIQVSGNISLTAGSNYEFRFIGRIIPPGNVGSTGIVGGVVSVTTS